MAIGSDDLWNRGLILHHEGNFKNAERLKRWRPLPLNPLAGHLFPYHLGVNPPFLDTPISDHAEGRALFHSFLWHSKRIPSYPIPSEWDPNIKAIHHWTSLNRDRFGQGRPTAHEYMTDMFAQPGRKREGWQVGMGQGLGCEGWFMPMGRHLNDGQYLAGPETLKRFPQETSGNIGQKSRIWVG